MCGFPENRIHFATKIPDLALAKFQILTFPFLGKGNTTMRLFFQIHAHSMRDKYTVVDLRKVLNTTSTRSGKLTDETELETRNKVLDNIWKNWVDGVFPFYRQIHTFAEHDLSSWINCYSLFRPDDALSYITDLKAQYKTALSAIGKISESFAEDCKIHYGYEKLKNPFISKI